MNIIPAIDLYDGKCVRLFKGDFNKMKSYSDDPVDMARHFESVGCTHLHLVDLQGAREGRVIQTGILESIAGATSLRIDFGGGIKTREDVDLVLGAGAHSFTAGSIAVSEPQRVVDWISQLGSEKVILGADARNRRIAVAGWNEHTDLDVIEFIHKYAGHGIRRAICTDIEVDGTLSGPSVELYSDILTSLPDIELIASGGVRDLSHIEQLIEVGIDAVIVGKAIYEGTLDLEKAIELC